MLRENLYCNISVTPAIEPGIFCLEVSILPLHVEVISNNITTQYIDSCYKNIQLKLHSKVEGEGFPKWNTIYERLNLLKPNSLDIKTKFVFY